MSENIKLTPAEKQFDEWVLQRRITGRDEYGHGLEFEDGHEWLEEQLEEAIDGWQYAACENMRLRAALKRVRQEVVELRYEIGKLRSEKSSEGT